ncbi:hypothetical protein [Cellulomonas sp. RIT-PI-Y]|uniref:hypothetical protein n=1 Tax=Cellulomonas sp. RIT-PI-Y TaxID=3035297 RepID=UPI0021DA7E91|nr:hypothetical protein [Cellulomonas sp. RIT-PI-Y]
MKLNIVRCAVAAASALGLIAAGSPAIASTAGSEIEETAALIARVAPDQGVVVAGDDIGGAIVAEVGDVVVNVPSVASEPIVIDSQNGEHDGAQLAVTLPSDLPLDHAEVADDGTVVYPGSSVSAAVQVLDNGSTRLQTVIENSSAPSDFAYSFGGGVAPVQAEDGAVTLSVTTEDAVLQLGQVDDAWAVDANGAPVRTWYTVEGDMLVQHVDLSSTTAFPVIADPKLTYGVGVYLNMTGGEWKAAAAALVGATVGGVTAACLGAKLPAGIGRIISQACTIIGVGTGINAFISSIRAVKNIKLTGTACYQMKIVPRGPLVKVNSSNCR